MKVFFSNALFMLKASFKVILITLALIVIILIPAFFQWKITLTLGILSLILTVLAGTDFVKKHTQVQFKKEQKPTDLWLVISVAVSIVGAIAICVDEQVACYEKIAYAITASALTIIAFCSARQSWLENKKPQ